jgi:hypothetical protein
LAVSTVAPSAAIAEILDSPEVAQLVAELDALRWTGRKGYGARALVGACLVKSLYCTRPPCGAVPHPPHITKWSRDCAQQCRFAAKMTCPSWLPHMAAKAIDARVAEGAVTLMGPDNARGRVFAARVR